MPQPVDPSRVSPAPATPLRLAVRSGDVRFVHQPIVIGHYRSEHFSGSEAVLDQVLDGELARALDLGVYAEAAGSWQLFRNRRAPRDNPWQLPRPHAVIVVGLGEEGTLRPAALADAVRQGVLAWAQRLDDDGDAPAGFELCATLLGSGGSGITVHDSAQAVARGVAEARVALARAARLPQVTALTLVELYLSRATEAWRALRVLETAHRGLFELDPVVQDGTGAITRPAHDGYRGAPYDFVQVTTRAHPARGTGFTYALDTRRARTEIRAQQLQSPLVRELVRTAADDAHADPDVGRTLFSLLVPLELRPYLASATELVLGVDAGSAPVPWEVLDDDDTTRRGDPAREPWALRVKMVRKFRTRVFRERVRDARRDDAVLVVGDPRTGDGWASLPGARREARAVAARFAKGGGARRVRLLVPPDGAEHDANPVEAVQVMNALFDGPYRVLHVAAHGEPPESAGEASAARGPDATPEPRGIVLSNGTHLGARELGQLPVVPELVFVNVCHGAQGEDGALLRGDDGHDRPRLAAGLAQSLVETGVRCVVAAGWAVDDEAATTFADAFYEALLAGERFIEAISRARHAAARHGGTTWAAYQCYGDPDWRLVRRPTDDAAPRAGNALPPEVASARGLAYLLEELRVRATYGTPDDRAVVVARLDAIDRELPRLRPMWADAGEVADALGQALAAAGRTEHALAWLDRAAGRDDAAVTLHALEQRANLRARLAWTRFAEAAAGDATRAGLRDAARDAREPMERALEEIAALVRLGETVERRALAGSVHKRLAMIARELRDRRRERRHLTAMLASYVGAAAVARASGGQVHYPLQNALAARAALLALDTAGDDDASAAPDDGDATPADDADRTTLADDVAAVRTALAEQSRRAPDFWSIVGLTELELLEALLEQRLDQALPRLAAHFTEHHERCSAPWLWGSVADQLRFVLGAPLVDDDDEPPRPGSALLAQVVGYAAAPP
jgi:hypothetical protein